MKFILLGLALCVLASACGHDDPIELDLLRNPVPTPSSRVWSTSKVIDLGELSSSYLQFNASDMSFGDFRMTRNSSAAILSSSFYSGSKYRVYNRIYWGNGTGWSGSGAGYSVVDNGAQDSRNLAASVSPNGAFLGVMSDGATTQSIASTALGAGWSFFQSSLGITPVLTHTAISGSVSGGYSTDIAWDAANSAFYGFLSGGVGTRATLLRYLGFVGWDAAASKISTPGRATQVRMLSEGNGVTMLWRGDEVLRATALSVGGGIGGSGAGDEFVCTVGGDGDLRCWGDNQSGQMGVGSVTAHFTQPTSSAAVTNSSIALSIAAGGGHACAIVDNGAVRCWGENANGQLGIGSMTDLTTAAGSNVSLSSTATALKLASGGAFSCAILNDSDRTIKCWGLNDVGQLGHTAPPCAATSCGDAVGEMGDYTDATDSGLPHVGAAAGAGAVLTTATEITAGSAHACVVLSSGKVKCWGENGNGQLGDDSTTDRTDPIFVQVAGAAHADLTSTSSVAAGDAHTCALINSGAVRCWGDNTSGQLGLGAAGGAACADAADADANLCNTVQTAAISSGVTQISAGFEHTCALINDGTVKCWGDNDYGQLGDGTIVDKSTPTKVTGLAERVVEISVHGDISCARLFSGAVQCWGHNDQGQIGNPDAPTASPWATTPYTAVTKCSVVDGGCALNSVRSTSNDFSSAFGEARTASTASSFSYMPKMRTFGADSDNLGTLVSVFVQEKYNYSSTSSSSCATVGLRSCADRVYAVTRTSGGNWTEPMQLDTNVNDGITSYYQNSTETGGIDYATPSVAYIGKGKFLVGYAVTEASSASLGKTQIYVRSFTTGVGWDSGALLLDSFQVNGQYRAVNELRVTGDGEGSALVMAQVVDPGTAYANASSRKYVYRAYVYDAKTSKWDSGQWIPGVAGCKVNQANCVSPRMDGAIFSGGTAVFVFPSVDLGDTTKVRLFSTEYVR